MNGSTFFSFNQVQFSRYEIYVIADTIWCYRTISRVSWRCLVSTVPRRCGFLLLFLLPRRINVEGGYEARVNATGLVPPHVAHNAVQTSGMARLRRFIARVTLSRSPSGQRNSTSISSKESRVTWLHWHWSAPFNGESRPWLRFRDRIEVTIVRLYLAPF